MANASFTRDEVILTLDVVYSHPDESLTKSNPAVAELCALLQALPIYPEDKRPANFRNTVGVSDQIRSFKQEASGIVRSRWGIGKLFHEVDREFHGKAEELHEIAEAIRKNKDFFNSCNFGQAEENDGFAEGSLLAHLHRVIERRNGVWVLKDDRCAICQISTTRIYDGNESFLEKHLLVPPTKTDANKKYIANDFVTVCPNCHAALHRYRPWRTKDNLTTILR